MCIEITPRSSSSVVAIMLCCVRMPNRRSTFLTIHSIAAVSGGVYRGQEVLDLNYDEGSTAGTDMNVVMTESGKFVEIQGTAESDPFGTDHLAKMLALAKKGVTELIQLQKQALGR